MSSSRQRPGPGRAAPGPRALPPIGGTDARIEVIAGEVVHEAVKLHIRFGPGLLESAYKTLLACALQRRGYLVEREKPVALEHEGVRISEALRVDLLIARSLVVELKSVEKLAPVHFKQVLTYLRLLELPLGLLINFGELTLKQGLHRVLNGYPPSPPSCDTEVGVGRPRS